MFMVREGSTQDFKAYVKGRDYPREWCVGDPSGLAVYEGNDLVAIAMVTIDKEDRTWIWFSQRVGLPAIILHRRALELLNALKTSDKVVHAFVDCNEPSAEKWFRKLGFVPAGVTTHPSGQEREVWLRK